MKRGQPRKIDMKKSRLLKSAKGKQYYAKRTICEVVRELCDFCVMEFYEDPELLNEIIFYLEDIFIMATKMNKRLIEYKLDTDVLFKPNKKNKKEVKEMREERTRLIKILEENEKILEERMRIWTRNTDIGIY